MLYIVATPIGNLEDITFRAIKVLKGVDYIACEDTRKSGILLKHYEIKNKLISFHSYSKQNKIDNIISKLKDGKDIALISDAGTPGISDPGYVLIKEAIKEDIQISPIPGVSAVITGLSASGLKSNHFLYLGFLPIKKGRQTILKKLKDIKETIIIYESVHRIVRTLNDLKTYLGEDKYIVIGRELTKQFEEFKRGAIKDIIRYYENNKSKVKGEFIVMF